MELPESINAATLSDVNETGMNMKFGFCDDFDGMTPSEHELYWSLSLSVSVSE